MEEVSYQTVRRTLKKLPQAPPEPEAVVDPTALQRRVRLADGGRAGGLHPPLRPAPSPGLCMDETSKQLLKDTQKPLPREPGRPERRDYEYERGGW